MRDEDRGVSCNPCWGISCPHWQVCFPELGTDIKELDAKFKKLVIENKRLRGFIEKHHPPNRHDHSYFHDDCGLCQMEKNEYEEVQQLLEEK